jgi:hypothetical protein
MLKKLLKAVKAWLDMYEDDVTFVQRTLQEQQKKG